MEQLQQMIHGGDVASYRLEHPGRIPVDFSANINPLALPETLQEAYKKAWFMSNEYPDPLCRDLKTAIGEFEKVAPDWILCGNGAADLIYRIVYALRPKTALLVAPTFAEYEKALQQVSAHIHHHLLYQQNAFEVDNQFIEAVPGHDMVFLCNPNNPTGKLCRAEFLEKLLSTCKDNGSYLVVDECFLEFLPEHNQYTMKQYLLQYEKLIILKAFTKIFAVPGLRLGYLLCASNTLLEKIDKAGAPWSVSIPAQYCGVAAAKEVSYVERSRRVIQQERGYLEDSLRVMGYKVFPGSVNYILFHTTQLQMAHYLREKGFLIRDCSNYEGLSEGFFRIAVRLRSDNDALLKAIKELELCSM